ncbi:hypothetical protein [Niallia endozanthoxylica]|uniref:Uncharacterized protein n=1 Tax=Niallia endozanthoxylica TaxID=2036016 RepID=A0A5J5I5G6_9BACI|nr:hypothetical protein [Niallia endozanthoxylica]KAA9030660.1 hypothetical protein F4V44_02395 [Niallia endozanthoxylica]
MSVGFELFTNQVLSVMPGDCFSMVIIQQGKKWASSAGKDVYHVDRLILPNKRIAATGRIHYLSTSTTNSYEALQTIPCIPIPLSDKERPNMGVALAVSNEKLAAQMKKISYLSFVMQHSKGDIRVPLYLDPHAFKTISSTEFHLDLSRQLEKHLPFS